MSESYLDAANRQAIRHQLITFASLSYPGARCVAMWPDAVASVHILDNGRRVRDVTFHTHPEMIEVLKERYPMLTAGAVVYLQPVSEGRNEEAMRLDLEDFFAGRNMLKLKESYP